MAKQRETYFTHRSIHEKIANIAKTLGITKGDVIERWGHASSNFDDEQKLHKLIDNKDCTIISLMKKLDSNKAPELNNIEFSTLIYYIGVAQYVSNRRISKQTVIEINKLLFNIFRVISNINKKDINLDISVKEMYKFVAMNHPQHLDYDVKDQISHLGSLKENEINYNTQNHVTERIYKSCLVLSRLDINTILSIVDNKMLKNLLALAYYNQQRQSFEKEYKKHFNTTSEPIIPNAPSVRFKLDEQWTCCIDGFVQKFDEYDYDNKMQYSFYVGFEQNKLNYFLTSFQSISLIEMVEKKVYLQEEYLFEREGLAISHHLFHGEKNVYISMGSARLCLSKAEADYMFNRIDEVLISKQYSTHINYLKGFYGCA